MKHFFFLLLATLFLLVPATMADPSSSAPEESSASPEKDPRYWISKTGKTHNSSCRYYKKSNGHGSDTPSGNDCKICGGASKHTRSEKIDGETKH